MMNFTELIMAILIGYAFYYFYPSYKGLLIGFYNLLRSILTHAKILIGQISIIAPKIAHSPIDLLPEDASWYAGYHMMIYGSTGKGKSTFVDWLISDILISNPDAKFILINPHHKAGQWGTRNVIGRGRNFSEIEEILPKIMGLMDARYDDYSDIEGISFEDIYIVIDEVPAIKQSIDNKVFSSFVKQMTSEARKVRIWLILITQSRYTKQLGFEGASDMLDNLLIIRVAKPKYFYSLIDENGDEQTAQGSFSKRAVAIPDRIIFNDF